MITKQCIYGIEAFPCTSFWKWIVKVKVAQLCPTLCDPMDYRVHGILQARILEWVAFSFSRGSSQPRDWTQVSHTAGRFFTRAGKSSFINHHYLPLPSSLWLVTHSIMHVYLYCSKLNSLKPSVLSILWAPLFPSHVLDLDLLDSQPTQ